MERMRPRSAMERMERPPDRTYQSNRAKMAFDRQCVLIGLPKDFYLKKEMIKIIINVDFVC